MGFSLLAATGVLGFSITLFMIIILFLIIDTPHGFECLTITTPVSLGKDLDKVKAA